VRVVADREQARALPQNVLPELSAGGVEVWLDGNFQAAHNKVVVIDADTQHATTITGSYNFTIAAQRGNAENVIVLRDNATVARAYRENWERLRASALAWSEDALR
jgi:phosphatidylserine/phosphatidylglycerophosphate/cardiolipin synthase-like enzyme